MDTETLLTKSQILEADDIKSEIVDVPEWGGKVKVSGLSAEQSIIVGSIMSEGEDSNPEELAELLVTAAALGMGWERSDVSALGRKSFSAVERVANKTMDLSGMTNKAAPKKKARVKT